MLPPKLSTNLTSLNEHADRAAIVVEILVSPEGQSELLDLYPAWVRNQAKLAYNHVSQWLEQKVPYPILDQVPGLKEQLHLQDRLAQKMKKFREEQGALFFASTELEPVISEGIVVELRERKESRANQLIEYFMIAANTAATQYLRRNRLPVFKRVVRTPKRWDRIVALAQALHYSLPPQPDAKALQLFLTDQRIANPPYFPDLCLAIIKLIGRGEYTLDPEPGHFDLALSHYAHTTAPNRRFPDLIMQRLLKSGLYALQSPYSSLELNYLARHCTEKENDAAKVERRMIKSAAAFVLQNQIGRVFDALVTGNKNHNVWVRLKNPPIEGKLVQGYERLDVGDTITVQLLCVNIPNGYIDFKRHSGRQ